MGIGRTVGDNNNRRLPELLDQLWLNRRRHESVGLTTKHRPNRLSHVADQSRDLRIREGEPEEDEVTIEKQLSEELYVLGAISEAPVVSVCEDQTFRYLYTPMQPYEERPRRDSGGSQVGIRLTEHIPRLLGFRARPEQRTVEVRRDDTLTPRQRQEPQPSRCRRVLTQHGL